MIRILLVEDQQLVAGALAALLRLEADLEVVGVAADGAAALTLAEQMKPDIVVTDIEMPNMTGLELAGALQRAPHPPLVVIVTTFGRTGYLRRALDAGVRGYLLKDRPAAELAAAVRTVVGGGRAIDPALVLDAWDAADPLTDRERSVLRLAGEGLASASIAESLGLSDGTVRNYLSEAIQKVGGANRVEAARIARDRGWL